MYVRTCLPVHRAGRVCVFYGNKCGSPLNAFMVDLLDVDESLGVTSKPPPHMLESGAQVQQLFEVECKGVFTSSPKLRIRFKCVCMCVCVCVCVCACARACVRACVRACMRMYVRYVPYKICMLTRMLQSFTIIQSLGTLCRAYILTSLGPNVVVISPVWGQMWL